MQNLLDWTSSVVILVLIFILIVQRIYIYKLQNRILALIEKFKTREKYTHYNETI